MPALDHPSAVSLPPVPDTLAPIATFIWEQKYRLRQADGTPVDREIADTWRRVANALAQPEADPALWEARFLEAMADFRFIPAGRIIAGAGSGRRVTLFNCFVMGGIGDDLGDIFANLREAALTMQQGGGIGYDFSSLRPKGAPVRGVGADASGPLSFMDVWDAMCRTIMSAGSRRGAAIVRAPESRRKQPRDRDGRRPWTSAAVPHGERRRVRARRAARTTCTTALSHAPAPPV